MGVPVSTELIEQPSNWKKYSMEKSLKSEDHHLPGWIYSPLLHYFLRFIYLWGGREGA